MPLADIAKVLYGKGGVQSDAPFDSPARDLSVRCIAAAMNSGMFRVFDPNGNVLSDIVVGETLSDQIKFEIADGATDFVVGAEFDVNLSAISETFVPINPSATDGMQTAAAISFEPSTLHRPTLPAWTSCAKQRSMRAN